MYRNGLDRFTLNLSGAFYDLGCRVDVVVPTITEYHQQVIKTLPSGVRSISLNLHTGKKSSIQKVIQISKYLKREKSTIFFANADYIGISNLANLMAGSNAKIVHIVHVSVSHYIQNSNSIDTKIKRFLLKHFYRRSNGIIAVSKGVAKDLSLITQIPLRKIQVIYNPVVSISLSKKASEDVAHPWFMCNNIPVILGAGRIMEQKDFETLIKAICKVRQKRACRLVIIGEISPHKKELDILIKQLDLSEEVAFLDFVNNPYAYMAKATVFVMSSKYEGFGNVLVEAMATGTPVVSTDCPSGPAEILADGRFGILVPVGDSSALADAILRTIDDPVDISSLQKRAAEFTVERIAKQYENFIRQFLS